jgi:hypothetical protein
MFVILNGTGVAAVAGAAAASARQAVTALPAIPSCLFMAHAPDWCLAVDWTPCAAESFAGAKMESLWKG